MIEVEGKSSLPLMSGQRERLVFPLVCYLCMATVCLSS